MPATAKKAKKTTAAKAKKAPTKSRAAKIHSVLEQSLQPKTVREACEAAGIPADEAKYVTSMLLGDLKQKKVARKKKECSVTGRTTFAYIWKKTA